jgi:hypothetical protein
MLAQNECSIVVKDLLKCWAAIGDPLSITITKARTRGHGKKTGSKSKAQIQELLASQLSPQLTRYLRRLAMGAQLTHATRSRLD